jgi:IS1 family transposase/DNA-directed RNA polymerase subunit RPC12/RpoP
VCYEEIACPRCASLHVKKNGTTANGKQKYRCTNCRRQFITDYTYRGCQSFIRELVVPMTMNSSGIRDIARVLSISTQTVMKTIRASAAEIREPRVPPRIKDLEIDEFWSFVKDKSRQCWCWYGLNRATTRIAAYVLGRRTDRSCRQLMEKLSGSTVEQFYTDDWQAYAKTLPPERHTISKAETLNIERHNLNFRTHLKRLHRRTICFSKSDEMHAAVIKLYVNHVNACRHKL